MFVKFKKEDSRRNFIVSRPVIELDEYFDETSGVVIHNGQVIGIEYAEE